MKKFFITTIAIALLSHTTGNAQEKMNTIRIEFEGIRYDSLNLVIWLEDENRTESIKGHSKDGYYWEFSYADNLHDRQYYSIFRAFATPNSVKHDLYFQMFLQGDTLKAGGFIQGRPISLIKARYVETKTFSRTDNYDIFEISTDDQDLISSMKAMHGRYGMLYDDKLSYEEIVQRQMEFIKQYPNSQFMICCLHMNMGMYKSKDDIAKVFNCFSKELQQSYFGQKINNYLMRVDTAFINQKFPTWDTDVQEAIVQDSSKYNLILFSASWCGPCIRQIPILKEIYQDLGQNLIMTYVSVDEEKTAENWRKKMREQEIPWRSLMALDMKATYEKYAIFGVPSAILVHPNNMKLEKLNLWEEKDRQRLYELLK
jgi:thiol-disulfide isomerase/thioredoxin